MKTIDFNMVLGRPGTHVGGVLTADDLLAEMDAQEIERAVVAHLAGAYHDTYMGNELLAEALQDAPRERLLPVPVIDLDDPQGGLDWERWEALGARGVRVCPVSFRRTVKVFDCEGWLGELQKRGWFLEVPVYPFPSQKGQTGSVDDAVTFAESREDLSVVIVCAGRYTFGQLCDALAAHENLFLDIEHLSTGSALLNLVEKGFADRLVCGSGYGVCCSTPFRDMVLYSDVPEPVQRKILYDNAAGLLAG